MARQNAPENAPASNWNHSHAVQEGDELRDEFGCLWNVTTVQDDGGIRVRRIDEDRDSANERDTWAEESVCAALRDGVIERERDGKTHELATY